MRLTTRTNLAARILMTCAGTTDHLLKTADIAKLCNSSTNHTAHVVQRLQAEGYVSTLRGRAGGIRLARRPDQISIGEMFRLFEGEIPIAECFDPETNGCPLTTACRLRSYIQKALDAFYHELDMVTLHDLVQGNCGLTHLLAMHPANGTACSPPQ
ncbi:Rrf2 family transcriptional regulator [Phaeobacter sp. QD34_3]|uniref:RrF2 family transcriptional regulator n=1 Tax=unclassified Phaeobacter TaxID=2621772 RepID=UPI00237F3E12|nr:MULTISPECIES: Rrf2 family transcriptional regulator [unclassified Phaeobacter]MDE4134875.1 Rrf2 family transcriptional regulator [Phaeobacter sp. QD34_3]MDE4138505.1 Rrf2 family transcriptional regulator [Phaeobacter sp. QD34_24]MDE4176516.1 Rrf2 family transcriptional regulator [Phaeobacter sp. PT47_59]